MLVCVKDACGWLMFVMIYGIIGYCDYVVVFWITLRHIGDFNSDSSSSSSVWPAILIIVTFNTCICCLLLAHIRTALTDPGRVPFPYESGSSSSSRYRGIILPAAASATTREQHLRKKNKKLKPKWARDLVTDDDDDDEMFSAGGVSSNVTSNSGANNNSATAVVVVAEDDAAHQRLISLCTKNDWTQCQRCHMLRPPRAHHCRTCRRCVRRMDHHCPWINNCVGAENQKYFLQFLFWTAVCTGYAAGMVIWSFWFGISSTPPDSKKSGDFAEKMLIEQQAQLLHCILVLMVCGLFLIFSLTMFIDQLSCIMHDRTTVEKASGEEWQRQMTPFDKVREVCGQSVPFVWLLPCTARKLQEHERYIDFSLINDDNDLMPPPLPTAVVINELRARTMSSSSSCSRRENWHKNSTARQSSRNSINNKRQSEEDGDIRCVEEMRPLATCSGAATAGASNVNIPTIDDNDADDDVEHRRYVI